MPERETVELLTESGLRQAVVLCEAYDSLREGLAIVLGDHYRVTVVSRIAELPPVLTTTKPALLILDVDGQSKPYAALKRLRRAHRTLKVLLLAGAFTLEEQMAAVRLSHVGFIKKFFSVESLLEKVDTLIRGYSRSPIRTRIVRLPIAPAGSTEEPDL